MAYIALKDVNTAYGSHKKGDIVPDIIGEKYSTFEKVKEAVEPEVKVEAPKAVEAPEAPKAKKSKKKKELLTEISDAVEVEITEE